MTDSNILFWGTFDTGKPRVRILNRGLIEIGAQVSTIHRDVWGTTNDKSQIKDTLQRVRLLCNWLTAYPTLIVKYLLSPRNKVIVVPYMGHLDVLILWPFAKLRREPIVWDAFISLYNTIVEDRALVSQSSITAKIIWAFEWLVCRLSSHIVLDTQCHGSYFAEQYGLNPACLSTVMVGVEPEEFPVMRVNARHGQNIKVLFYGQFIPLHGIETIIEAANLATDLPIKWTLVGEGQEAKRIESLLERKPITNLNWIKWVEYDGLKDFIDDADVCLGIFGTGIKASMVIPNKVFQIIHAGKPLVTRDSNAIRELLGSEMPKGLYLVAPGSAEELLSAIRLAADASREGVLYEEIRQNIIPKSIGEKFLNIIDKLAPSTN